MSCATLRSLENPILPSAHSSVEPFPVGRWPSRPPFQLTQTPSALTDRTSRAHGWLRRSIRALNCHSPLCLRWPPSPLRPTRTTSRRCPSARAAHRGGARRSSSSSSRSSPRSPGCRSSTGSRAATIPRELSPLSSSRRDWTSARLWTRPRARTDVDSSGSRSCSPSSLSDLHAHLPPAVSQPEERARRLRNARLPPQERDHLLIGHLRRHPRGRHPPARRSDRRRVEG